MPQAVRPASASPDSTPLPMDPACSRTVMPIPSAPSASRASSCAFSVLLPRTESSSSLKASVCAWTDTTLTPRTTVCPAEPDAALAHQPPTAPCAWLWPPLLAMVSAPALLAPTSSSPLTESDTAVPADPTASPASMATPALPACPPSPRLLITSVSALLRTSSTPPDSACLAPLAANSALQPPTALAASVLLFSREPSARALAIVDSLP